MEQLVPGCKLGKSLSLEANTEEWKNLSLKHSPHRSEVVCIYVVHTSPPRGHQLCLYRCCPRLHLCGPTTLSPVCAHDTLYLLHTTILDVLPTASSFTPNFHVHVNLYMHTKYTCMYSIYMIACNFYFINYNPKF